MYNGGSRVRRVELVKKKIHSIGMNCFVLLYIFLTVVIWVILSCPIEARKRWRLNRG